MSMDLIIKRYDRNPVFPSVEGTWMESQTANPDLLMIGKTYFMYFRGQQGGHDRIGLATISKTEFDGKTWEIRPEPVIDVGQPGDWDEIHALDPASVLVDGRVYLYYSAVCPTCNRSVCLATSEDGIYFEKYEGNPVVIGSGPEIVFNEGVFYLYYVKLKKAGKGREIYLAASGNGHQFEEVYKAAGGHRATRYARVAAGNQR